MPDGKRRDRSRENQLTVADEIASELAKLSTMDSLSPKYLVKYADDLGDFLANKARLKTSQLRKFLDAVNGIKARSAGIREDYSSFEEDVILLKPKLAYTAGRIDEVKPLMTVLEPCMDKVKSEKDFFKFYRFVEAILAYHRYHGGRE